MRRVREVEEYGGKKKNNIRVLDEAGKPAFLRRQLGGRYEKV